MRKSNTLQQIRQKPWYARFDWILTGFIFIFLAYSCMTVYSAQMSGQYINNFAIRQLLYYALGWIIILSILFIKPLQIQKLSWIAYGLGIASLVFLIIAPTSIAPIINGAKSWIRLPGLNFSIQPTELMKIFLMMALAQLISWHNHRHIHTIKNDVQLILKVTGLSLVPLFLVLHQNDLGSTLVLLAIIFFMLFASGISWKIITPFIATLTIIISTLLWIALQHKEWLAKILQGYQMTRIYAWLSPADYADSGSLQVLQAQRAISNGATLGKGYLNGETYVSENHTDFIFSVIGEEFGFIGASLLIIFYLLLIFHLLRIAVKQQNDYFIYFISGLLGLLTFQIFENIGMILGILPVTGLPLPLISFGGSALWGVMFAFAIIFNIQFHEHAKYYKQ